MCVCVCVCVCVCALVCVIERVRTLHMCVCVGRHIEGTLQVLNTWQDRGGSRVRHLSRKYY